MNLRYENKNEHEYQIWKGNETEFHMNKQEQSLSKQLSHCEQIIKCDPHCMYCTVVLKRLKKKTCLGDFLHSQFVCSKWYFGTETTGLMRVSRFLETLSMS